MAAFLTNPAPESVFWLRLHAAARVNEDACIVSVCHLTDEDVVVARWYGVMRRKALIFIEKLAAVGEVSPDAHIRSVRQSHREILNGGVEGVEAYQLV